MPIMLSCPHCGTRPHSEFWYGGEVPVRGAPATEVDLEEDFERVWLHRNARGLQEERWFHWSGCRRWLTVVRDTRNNKIHDIL